jgi:DNA-binding response OmpR family regulator
VVEDDEPIRAMLAELLSDAGYRVIEAANGKEALRRLSEHRPDLIVLDLVLPRMSGWEFLDRSREQLDRLNLPVMIVSAIEGKSDYPSALGVAAWFTKPLDIPRFLSAVERLAGSPYRRSRLRAVGSSFMARLLIVEDEGPIGDLLKEHFETEGFQPELVTSLTDARQRIEAEPPDLILLDLMLPDEDGWAFLKSRKGDPMLQAIPTVAISSAPHQRLIEAKNFGADAFLSKPFDLDALTALVRSFVG